MSTVLSVLVARDAELRDLADLADRARAGIGGVIVVRGEPGSGKSALLDHAVSALPADVTVLRGLGVESEAHLTYAGLTGVLRPLLDLLPGLPSMQRSALAGALALEGAELGGDQLAVAAGTLALLAAGAALASTVVVVDDLQWVEPSSRFALLFAARRIANDRLGIILAVRDGTGIDDEIRDLPQLHVGGLDLESSARLLSSRGSDLSPAVIGGLVDATGGNPLALIESARNLDEWQVAGMRPLGSALTVGDHLESAFAVRLDALSPGGRAAVTLVSAEPSGDRSLLMAVAGDLGLGAASFHEALDAALLEESPSTINMRHPLMRSVALRRADRDELARIHRSLADHLDRDGQSERRAWHLAAATDGPDELVAGLLESAAQAAWLRSDVATAVSGFEQAAALSPAMTDRGRRLLRAGEVASQLGQGDELLRQAHACADDDLGRAEIVLLRARAAIEIGDLTRVSRLVREEAASVQRADRLGGAVLLALGASAAWSAAQFDEMQELVHRSLGLIEAGDDLSGPVILPVAMALIASVVGGRPDPALTRQTVAAAARPMPSALAPPVLNALIVADQLDAAETLRDHARRQCRDEGSLVALTWVDGVAMILAVRRGELAQAYAIGTAVLELFDTIASPFGQVQVQGELALVEALTGREDACRGRVEAVRRTSARLGTDVVTVQTNHALGMLELGLGRFLAAARQLERVHDDLERRGHVGVGYLPALTDLIEARVLAGEEAEARQLLTLLETHAGADPLPFAALVASRAAAILAPEQHRDAAFDDAIARARTYGNAFELGRMHLAYGRRLAASDQVQGGEQLRLASECFQHVQASPWVDRAVEELGRIGRAQPPVGPSPTQLLTPHEQQVAALAVTGATTREIAAALLMSPKTVESHLTATYRKLGVRSKTQLAHLFNRSQQPRSSS